VPALFQEVVQALGTTASPCRRDDGQLVSIRNAVQRALPELPSAVPVSLPARGRPTHLRGRPARAKVQLKKNLGTRKIERRLEARSDQHAGGVDVLPGRAECTDGRWSRAAGERLASSNNASRQIRRRWSPSSERRKGPSEVGKRTSSCCMVTSIRALQHEQPAWPEIGRPTASCCRPRRSWNLGDDTAETVERQFARVLQRMEQEASRDGSRSASLQHFPERSAGVMDRTFFATYPPGAGSAPGRTMIWKQFFGSARYPDVAFPVGSRCPPSTVIRVRFG
jgi:hypothetical protein